MTENQCLIYTEGRVLLFAAVSEWGLLPIQWALVAVLLKVKQLVYNSNHQPQVPKVRRASPPQKDKSHITLYSQRTSTNETHTKEMQYK
jgi:hypothetical protein